MKNRKLLLVVSLVLALTMSLGGTLAYLTDTDEAVNVMTLGNVKIEQLELQRKEGITYNNDGVVADGDELETFEQGQALYPAYAADKSYYSAKMEDNEQFWWGPYVTADVSGNGSSNGLFDDRLVGALDKFVFVKNTGTSDAYFRTWLAFECPISLEYDPDHVKDLWINANLNSRFTWSEGFYTEIEGVRYLVMCVTYNLPLAAGEIARPSLLQVALSEYADNEDMEALGSTYEILALTQAVQTNNMPDAVTALNAAFGAVAADNHPWDDEDGDGDVIPELPTTVAKNAAELQAALEKGGTVMLTQDITVEETIEIPAGVAATLNLNGMTITGTMAKGDNVAVLVNAGTLTVKGGTIKNTVVNGAAVIRNNGTMVLDDVAIIGAPIADGSYPDYAVYTAGKLTVEDGASIISDRGAINMSDGADVTINGGNFTVTDALGTRTLTSHVIYAYGYNSKLTINGGNFAQNYEATPNAGASVICPAGATINIYDGNFTFAGEQGSQSGIFQNYMGYGAPVNVYGGTYNDTTVNKNLAVGYQAVESNGVWTVSAK